MNKFNLCLFLFSQLLVIFGVESKTVNDSRLVLPRKFDCCWTPLVVSPECGEDGRTYVNPCTRAFEGITLRKKGYCEFDSGRCLCSKIYLLECGVDGVTYDNNCLRNCFEVELDYTGECVEHPYNSDSCCSSDYGVDLEVSCGVNGVEYMSICERECAVVEADETGEACDDSYELKK